MGFFQKHSEGKNVSHCLLQKEVGCISGTSKSEYLLQVSSLMNRDLYNVDVL